jgi:hypothetical protein
LKFNLHSEAIFIREIPIDSIGTISVSTFDVDPVSDAIITVFGENVKSPCHCQFSTGQALCTSCLAHSCICNVPASSRFTGPLLLVRMPGIFSAPVYISLLNSIPSMVEIYPSRIPTDMSVSFKISGFILGISNLKCSFVIQNHTFPCQSFAISTQVQCRCPPIPYTGQGQLAVDFGTLWLRPVELVSQPYFETIVPSVLPLNSAEQVTLYGKALSDEFNLHLNMFGTRMPLTIMSANQAVTWVNSSMEKNVTCFIGMDFDGQVFYLHKFLVLFRHPALIHVELDVIKSVFSVGGVIYFKVNQHLNDILDVCRCTFMNVVDAVCSSDSTGQYKCFVPHTIDAGTNLLTCKFGYRTFNFNVTLRERFSMSSGAPNLVHVQVPTPVRFLLNTDVLLNYSCVYNNQSHASFVSGNNLMCMVIAEITGEISICIVLGGLILDCSTVNVLPMFPTLELHAIATSSYVLRSFESLASVFSIHCRYNSALHVQGVFISDFVIFCPRQNFETAITVVDVSFNLVTWSNSVRVNNTFVNSLRAVPAVITVGVLTSI